MSCYQTMINFQNYKLSIKQYEVDIFVVSALLYWMQSDENMKIEDVTLELKIKLNVLWKEFSERIKGIFIANWEIFRAFNLLACSFLTVYCLIKSRLMKSYKSTFLLPFFLMK